jgi:hypothetical protein
LPRGRLTEVYGQRSSGRMAAAVAALAAATSAGELAAIVDVPDAFDPRTAAMAGVVLERVLWVRARALAEGLIAADRVLDAGGFALVVLYLPGANLAAKVSRVEARPRRVPDATWLRLLRRAERARTAVLIVADRPHAGTFAQLGVEVRRERIDWNGVEHRRLAAIHTILAVRRGKRGAPSDEEALLELPVV